jgi:hypothetical protein
MGSGSGSLLKYRLKAQALDFKSRLRLKAF